MKRLLFVLALLLAATSGFAQQDNSFLIEEAYNQEPGVVQHINMLLFDSDTDSFLYEFSQEWPIRSMKHQFSYTVPVGYLDGSDFELGDISLSYRYQLRGDANAKLAIAPSFSVSLPTGEGSEDTGLQAGLPVSYVLNPRLVTHTNVGIAWFSDDRDTEFFAGQSLVFAVNSRLQAHLEALWSGNGDDGELLIAPGIRWAHDLKNGAQLVPGVGYVRSDNGGDAVLLYLSYER